MGKVINGTEFIFLVRKQIKKGVSMFIHILSEIFFFTLSFNLSLLIQQQSSFGKVTIQIDRVVMLGAVAGEYTLMPESKSGPSRNLEIEFQWSNK
jgi:hypothetical protein